MAAHFFLACLSGQLFCAAGAGAGIASAYQRPHVLVAKAAATAADLPARQQGLAGGGRGHVASLAQWAHARLRGAWAEPENWEGRSPTGHRGDGNEQNWEGRSPTGHHGDGNEHLGEPQGHLGDGHPGLGGKWGVVAEAVAETLSPLPGRQYDDAKRFWLLLAFSGVLYVFLSTLIAWHRSSFQKPELHDKDDVFRGNKMSEWSTHILDFDAIKAEPWICFWSCCVPCVRWAETMNLSTILPFWHAFWIFVFFTFLQITLPFALLFYCILTIILTYYRQQLRKDFDMKHDPPTYEEHHFEFPKVAAMDCCCYLWCGPCTLAQEARHVEASLRTVFPASPSPYTGQPSSDPQPSPSGRLAM